MGDISDHLRSHDFHFGFSILSHDSIVSDLIVFSCLDCLVNDLILRVRLERLGKLDEKLLDVTVR